MSNNHRFKNPLLHCLIHNLNSLLSFGRAGGHTAFLEIVQVQKAITPLSYPYLHSLLSFGRAGGHTAFLEIAQKADIISLLSARSIFRPTPVHLLACACLYICLPVLLSHTVTLGPSDDTEFSGDELNPMQYQLEGIELLTELVVYWEECELDLNTTFSSHTLSVETSVTTVYRDPVRNIVVTTGLQGHRAGNIADCTLPQIVSDLGQHSHWIRNCSIGVNAILELELE
ncbi:hypothetical protein J6590_067797 [Homalodisca vitripennis]|nr:hypothetical protein J6590_067797 [Homalodisca vitripennis]